MFKIITSIVVTVTVSAGAYAYSQTTSYTSTSVFSGDSVPAAICN